MPSAELLLKPGDPRSLFELVVGYDWLRYPYCSARAFEVGDGDDL
jgi:hypothetical protein